MADRPGWTIPPFLPWASAMPSASSAAGSAAGTEAPERPERSERKSRETKADGGSEAQGAEADASMIHSQGTSGFPNSVRHVGNSVFPCLSDLCV